jgi:hypothetical protein
MGEVRNLFVGREKEHNLSEDSHAPPLVLILIELCGELD